MADQKPEISNQPSSDEVYYNQTQLAKAALMSPFSNRLRAYSPHPAVQLSGPGTVSRLTKLYNIKRSFL
jgi:hypothetical protein